jgi:hypothetical protein
MKNTTNTLNKLTKLLAITIFSVSLNTFSVVLDPLITISTNHVSATYVLDCVACFLRARLVVPTPTAITTVAVS